MKRSGKRSGRFFKIESGYIYFNVCIVRNYSGIVVQYEFRAEKVNVPDIRDFYDSLQYDEWVKTKGYDKKYAAVGYVNFLPAGSKMEILGKDDEGAYLRIGSTVYLAPARVYDYLTSFVGSN